MNKTVTITLDEDAHEIFEAASGIVSKAGIRVPTSQLVQTMMNAEIRRLDARKVAQRFLKSVIQQVGGIRIPLTEEEDDGHRIPQVLSLSSKA